MPTRAQRWPQLSKECSANRIFPGTTTHDEVLVRSTAKFSCLLNAMNHRLFSVALPSSFAVALLLHGSLAVSSTPTAEKEVKTVMCQWFANGKTEFMCLKKPMKDAQKECNEYASKQRGDDSKCSCTSDANYIRNTCDGISAPPPPTSTRANDQPSR
jgi:hypothetical protein